VDASLGSEADSPDSNPTKRADGEGGPTGLLWWCPAGCEPSLSCRGRGRAGGGRRVAEAYASWACLAVLVLCGESCFVCRSTLRACCLRLTCTLDAPCGLFWCRLGSPAFCVCSPRAPPAGASRALLMHPACRSASHATPARPEAESCLAVGLGEQFSCAHVACAGWCAMLPCVTQHTQLWIRWICSRRRLGPAFTYARDWPAGRPGICQIAELCPCKDACCADIC